MSALLDILTFGNLQVVGRIVDASNVALQCELQVPGMEMLVIYKPVSGERELWDFPDGTLAGREAASFVLSAACGWDIVPPTVFRDGPYGPGTVQIWVEAAQEAPDDALVDVMPVRALRKGWLRVFEAETYDGTAVVVAHADRPDLASTAVFDAVVNNADRKGSHLVLDSGGRLRGFDHGLTFNESPKLRTVLWGWSGKPLPTTEVERLGCLAQWLEDPATAVSRSLETLITPREAESLRRRVARLLAANRFPEPSRHRPAVPWPPL